MLGIANLNFGDFPDGDMVDHLADLRAWIDDLADQRCPDAIVTLAFEQGHLDHDALALATSHRAEPSFEFPMYHTYCDRIQTVHRFSNGEEGSFIELTAEEKRWKRALCSCYPSQRIRWILEFYAVWKRVIGEPELLGHERLRPATWTDFLRPNLPDPGRVLGSSSWARWEAAASRYPAEPWTKREKWS
jgi:hypothetical protein